MGLQVYMAEKPKMGRVIAQALAARQGVPCPREEKGAQMIRGNGWAVGWLAGHAYTLYDTADYRPEWAVGWNNMPLPLLPEPFRFKPIDMEHLVKIRAAMSSLLTEANSVVIATDAGQEGQIIAEIFLSENNWSGPTYRLWSSAQEIEAMKSALSSIESNDLMKYQGHKLSGLARMKSDWLIGINLTIAYTRLARKAGYNVLASAGRVQSALLAICVDHEDKVLAFKSGHYYDMVADLVTADGTRLTAELVIPEELLDGKHCTDRDALQTIMGQLQGQSAKVSAISSNTHTRHPPTPFNLTNLCIYMGGVSDMSAAEVVAKYQEMYEAGHLTYTRTDDTFYEDEQLTKIGQLFDALAKDEELAPLVAGANKNLRPSSFCSSKITEHPANSPTSSLPNWGNFDSASRQIYLAVAKRLIAQFYPDYISTSSTAAISIGGQQFQTKGVTVDQAGWTQVQPLQGDEDDRQPLPTLTKGQSLTIESIRLEAKKTRAPARMTESRLLKIMENASGHLSDPRLKERLKDNASLGTSATRHTYVDLLVQKRKFLSLYPDKTLRPTKLGRQVRSLLPVELTSPDLTALWEISFNKIRLGRQEPDAFMNNMKTWISAQCEKATALKLERNPMAVPCSAPSCESVMIRRESKANKGMFFWMCTDDDCRNYVADDGGKPVEPLAGDGTPCPTCGEPFKTRMRKRNLKNVSKTRHHTDRRYIMCANKHFPPKTSNNKPS
ncbi:DNA topoisomerase [Marinobacterium stanieri]|uniref:DNA topoisomerase n=1 Tax=Marinobacterium stanieri TaxID=49186 RepID=A0A1N6XAA8_9GAMM|nr:DNA topoisomerase [Marinobacterium stanieri]SIQ99207.1 DNA topoisomerase-3 [Marinobacterium stanieri]